MCSGRRLVLGGVAAALGLVALAGFPGRANACSGTPGVYERTVFPPAGARDVPTNVRLVVNYVVNAAVVNREGTIGLRPMGGEVVAADVRRSQVRQGLAVVLTPASRLQPETQYEVVDNLADIPCSSAEMCIAPGPPRVISTFVTGVAADTTPPSLTGPVDARMLRGDACESSGCCGPYRGMLFDLEWRGASDDHPAGVAGFNVYDEDTLVASMLPGPTSAEGGYLECEGTESHSSPVSTSARAWSGSAPSTSRATRARAASSGSEMNVPAALAPSPPGAALPLR